MLLIWGIVLLMPEFLEEVPSRLLDGLLSFRFTSLYYAHYGLEVVLKKGVSMGVLLPGEGVRKNTRGQTDAIIRKANICE